MAPLPYQLHQKLRAPQQQTRSSSNNLEALKGLPFWLWDKQQHTEQYIRTEGQCCFNHVVGLAQKDKKEYPLFDYEKLLYDSLSTSEGSFKDKHIWVKKATGLGVREFMLGLMAWLSTRDDSCSHSQMCIVTGPNIEMATKLIKRAKGIFEPKLGNTFSNKETVLELNGCTLEAFPSNHVDSFRALDNPKFILLDEEYEYQQSGCSKGAAPYSPVPNWQLSTILNIMLLRFTHWRIFSVKFFHLNL